MSTPVTEWLSFEDFKRLVDRSEYKVRQALAVLSFTPQVHPVDQRRIVYNPDWVEKVRDWIDGRR
jgi:hypothetical protein